MVGEEAVGVGAYEERADAAGGVVGLQALYCLDEVHFCGEGGYSCVYTLLIRIRCGGFDIRGVV